MSPVHPPDSPGGVGCVEIGGMENANEENHTIDSEDGGSGAGGSEDGTESSLDVPECTLSWQACLPGEASGLAVSVDGLLVAAGGVEPEMSVLRAADGSTLHELRGHAGGVNCLAFLACGTLISVGQDRRLCTWDARTGGDPVFSHLLPVRDTEPDGWSGQLATSRKSDTWACSAGESVTLFQFQGRGDTTPAVHVLRSAGQHVTDLRFDRDDNLLAASAGGISRFDFDSRGFDRPNSLFLPYRVSSLGSGMMV